MRGSGESLQDGSPSFAFAYVANYAGESEALKAALERIQGAARRLIEAAVKISLL